MTTPKKMPQSFRNGKEVVRKNHEISIQDFNSKEKEVDIVEATIGTIGKWQLKVYALMFVIFVPSSWVELGIELFAHQTDFFCKSTEFLNETITFSKNSLKNVCNTLRNSSNPCPYGFVYDTSLVGTTIISEWDLVCDKQYLISIIQIMIMFGSLLGGIAFGIAADKYGRRVSLLVSCLLRFFCGILSAFATNVVNFTILRFMLAFFDGGVPAISLMMCVEILGGKWRIILAILLQIGFSLGFPIMAAVTYALKDWREAQLALALLSLLSAVCAWISPESPRWLLAIGEKHQAVRLLEKAAKENKRNSYVVKKVMLEFDSKYQGESDECSWWFLFKTPRLRRRTILACVNGAVVFMMTNGFYQYFGEFSNNPFFDLCLQGVSAILGAVIASIVVLRYNRKHTLALMSCVIALCSFSILLFLNSASIRSVLSTLTLCSLGVTIAIIEPLMGELFPTVLRNSGFGVFSIFSGIGTMIAPIIIQWGESYWFLPLITFAFLALLEVVLVLLLPDNPRHRLADTIEDIEY